MRRFLGAAWTHQRKSAPRAARLLGFALLCVILLGSLTGSTANAEHICSDIAVSDKVEIKNNGVLDAISGTAVVSTNSTANDKLKVKNDGNAALSVAENVTITRHSGGHVIDTGYTGTVTLSTSTSNGDWSLLTGAGSLANSGNGAATYAFAVADAGQVVLGLADTYTETVNSNLSDGVIVEDAGEDSSIAFAASGFIFLADNAQSAIGIQIGGKDSATAPGSQLLELQAVRTSDNTGQCESFLTGAVTVAMAFECENPTSCTANLVSISGTNVAANNNGAALSYSNVNLDFGTAVDTTATFTVNYPDVGQIQLHAVLTLSPSGETLLGESNSFVVRPFAFDVSVSGNTGPTDESGAALTSAGTDFTATARAVLWSSADDTDNDGIADGHTDTTPANNADLTNNTSALNFGNGGEDVVLGATLNAPGGGNDPGLSGGTTIGSFTSGSGSTTTAVYNEVGIIEISSRVGDGDYLGIGASASNNIVGRSGTVGRFTPFAFAVSYNTPSFNESCTSGAFTYLDQPFSYNTAPVITVTAQNRSGATTQNYAGVWWMISNATLANRSYSAASGTLDTSGLPGTGSDPSVAAAGSGMGTLTFASGSGLLFTRSATPVAPFDAEISVEIDVTDSDGISYASNPAKFGAASAGNGMSFTSDKRMRFGRLALSNAYGSEVANLSVALEAEYFNGTAFTLNSDDSCSSVSAGDLNLTKNPAGILSTVTIDNQPLLLGEGGLWLSPAGSGNDGTIDLSLDLSAATGANLGWGFALIGPSTGTAAACRAKIRRAA